MTLHPVIRLRDSRRFPEPNHINGDNKNARIEKRINNTCRRLFAMPGHVNKGEVRSSLDSMHTLVEHYFAFRSVKKGHPRKPRDGLFYASPSAEKGLSQFLRETNNKQTRLLLMGLLNAYLQAKVPQI